MTELFAPGIDFDDEGVPTDGEAQPEVGEQGLLIADETRLTRDQVLSLAFTPFDVIKGRRVIERRVRVSKNEVVASIAPSSSLIAPQIRQVYDRYHFAGIGRSMKDDYAGQLHRGHVGVHSERSAEAYLADLNEHFETELELEERYWHEKMGGFLITIAGHNRQLGAAIVNLETNGHPDHGIPFEVRLYDDPQFWQAIRIQASENSGQNPHMWERSREIKSMITLSWRDGNPVSVEEVAKIFCTDVDQVNRALQFESLPDEIKQLAIDDLLPYSGAFELNRLFKLYEEKDVIALAHRFAATKPKLSAEKIRQEVQTRERVKDLPDEVRVQVDLGLIKYAQAEVLAEMHDAGVDQEVIMELARWVSIDHPPLTELRLRAQKHKGAALKGDRNIFLGEEGEEGLSEEDRQAANAQIKENSTRATLATRSRRFFEELNAMVMLIESGLVGEGIEHRPVARQINGELLEKLDYAIDVLRKEGDEDAASQLERRRDALSALKPIDKGSKTVSLFD